MLMNITMSFNPLIPRFYDIEVTRRCNVRCKFCPRDKIRNIGDMTSETFKYFLEKVPIRPWDFVVFCGLGEALLNPMLPEYMTLLRRCYPDSTVGLVTNGTLLNHKYVPSLLEADVNHIMVSFNGIEPETYERLMKGADFKRTMANLEYTRDEIYKRQNSKTKLSVCFILSKENIQDESKIKDFWAKKGIGNIVQYMHNRGGFVSMKEMTPIDYWAGQRKTCMFENFTFVAWNGDVLCCCHDIRHQYIIGNISMNHIDIINSRKEEIIKQNKWPSICNTCTDRDRPEQLRYQGGKEK